MKKLHPLQDQLLEILQKHRDDPLTIRELQQELGMSSPSVVYHHIQQLEKKGYLRRNPGNPRDYQVLSASPEKQVTYVNLYGLAQCGPHGSILDGNPVDRIPFSSRMFGFPAREAFMVKARGDSMVPKISDGDYVLARCGQNAENGDIVVCVNEGEALIKKFKRQTSSIILISLNSDYEPFLAAEDFRIEGVVKGVYSHMM